LYMHFLKQSYKQIFTPSPFSVLLSYFILSKFDNNFPPKRKNLDSIQIGLHQHCQLEAYRITQLTVLSPS
jgi:hypothetical protein